MTKHHVIGAAIVAVVLPLVLIGAAAGRSAKSGAASSAVTRAAGVSGTVTFDGVWTGSEAASFGKVIKAFNKVAQVRGREVQCRLMIGLCHREQGNHSEAVHQFKLGLHEPSVTALLALVTDATEPGSPLTRALVQTARDAGIAATLDGAAHS